MRQNQQFPSDKLDKLLLRMPDGLRRRLKAEADSNRRSMNAEAIYLLERAIQNSEETQKGQVTA